MSENFQEFRVTVKDIMLSYIDEGNKSATPIIFIHGFPLNKSMWYGQVNELVADWRVLAYDVRGHGDTDMGTQPFTIDQLADDLIWFMDELGIEKAVVCGLSMGGYIALNAIGRYAPRFAGLVLCDTTCRADTPEGKEKRQKAIELVETAGLGKYALGNLPNLFTPTSIEARTKAVAAVKAMMLGTSAEAVTATLRALASRSETCSQLPIIKVPVGIIVGSEDKLTPPEAAKAMQALMPHAMLEIIEGAGHLPNLEDPDGFNHALKAVLAGF